MPGKYVEDREWSDLYIPAVKQIVGPLLLEETSFEVDTNQAADLIVMKARDMMIAARVRRPGYAERYPWEFTIRSYRDNGTKTEMQKIVDGFGDYVELHVHRIFVLGKDALIRTEIAGHGNAKMYVKKLGSTGVLDPIDQRQSIGFKIDSVGFGSARTEAVVLYYCIPSQANSI